MGQPIAEISPGLAAWIRAQKLFFVATAPLSGDGHVNLSPKGLDSFRVLGPREVAYLDLTGSGAETMAHLRENGRITVMFCAFEGPPKILRLYGRGRTIRRGSAEYAELLASEFGNDEPLGARQMVSQDIDLVQTSCGFGVPLFDYAGERPTLARWAEAKEKAEGLDAYRWQKNRFSLDGLPTGLFEEEPAE